MDGILGAQHLGVGHVAALAPGRAPQDQEAPLGGADAQARGLAHHGAIEGAQLVEDGGDALAAGLFFRREGHHHFAFQLLLRQLEGREQKGGHAALGVVGAQALEPRAIPDRREGIPLPTRAGRHGVQVGVEQQPGATLPAEAEPEVLPLPVDLEAFRAQQVRQEIGQGAFLAGHAGGAHQQGEELGGIHPATAVATAPTIMVPLPSLVKISASRASGAVPLTRWALGTPPCSAAFTAVILGRMPPLMMPLAS